MEQTGLGQSSRGVQKRRFLLSLQRDSFRGLTSIMNTFMPALANAKHAARPIPLLAVVQAASQAPRDRRQGKGGVREHSTKGSQHIDIEDIDVFGSNHCQHNSPPVTTAVCFGFMRSDMVIDSLSGMFQDGCSNRSKWVKDGY